MPWKDVDMMTLRQEFTALAQQDGVNFSALCARFGISRKTGYKWRERSMTQGPAGLQDCSRRPCNTPLRTSQANEELVVKMRLKHPTWGGRKIHRSLLNQGRIEVPTPSTITRILHRHGLISEKASANSTAWQRFEHAQPNDLWQIDFKGHFQTGQATCHPLTVLDDHSRYNIVLQACLNPDTATVQAALETAFRHHGMPVRINADNGSPWGSPSQHEHGITKLTIWLIQLGIRISHSRPAHPQTNGKDERFHRTLKADVLHGRHFFDLQEVQNEFDRWRMIYNNERPHEAICMATPVTRFRQSRLAYPERLPEIVYPQEDLVETVGWNGHVKFHKRSFRVSSALHRHRIAARALSGQDGIYDLYFAHQRFGQINLRGAEKHD